MRQKLTRWWNVHNIQKNLLFPCLQVFLLTKLKYVVSLISLDVPLEIGLWRCWIHVASIQQGKHGWVECRTLSRQTSRFRGIAQVESCGYNYKVQRFESTRTRGAALYMSKAYTDLLCNIVYVSLCMYVFCNFFVDPNLSTWLWPTSWLYIGSVYFRIRWHLYISA